MKWTSDGPKRTDYERLIEGPMVPDGIKLIGGWLIILGGVVGFWILIFKWLGVL